MKQAIGWIFFIGLCGGLQPGSAAAQCGCIFDPDFCGSTVASNGGTLFSCPAGDATRLDEINATISLTLIVDGEPFEGMPATDMWLIDADPNIDLVLCGGWQAIDADGPTDSNGQTTFSGSWAVGGCADGAYIVIAGYVLTDCTEIPIEIPINARSADLNGDLSVDLADLSIFSAAYPPNGYDTCADFNGDGQVNIADLSAFAFHYSPDHQCSQ